MTPSPLRVDLCRRRILAAAAASCLLTHATRAVADTERFPTRPVTLIVPWPAGGGTDMTMRLLADIAGRHLGQKVLIENRGGAGGTLAMPTLANAVADGYTIAQMPQTVFRAPWTQKVLWDPVRDTTPIIQLSGVTFVIVTRPASGIRTLDDIFEVAKTKAGGMNVATNGVGTTPHLVIEQLMNSRRLEYVHVPYKGVGEQMMGVVTGQVDIGIGATGFAPHVENGNLRMIATFSHKRSKKWPDVPTLKELGHDLVAMSPYGLAGPHGMSADVVKILHDAFKLALFDPAHVDELDKFDQVPDYLGPEAYAKAMKAQLAAEKINVEKLGLAKGGLN